MKSSIYYNGTVLTIVITADGSESIKQLNSSHNKQTVRELARAGALVKRLGDTGKLRSPDQFRQEGVGFWAIRAGTVRLYGWYDPNQTFVISHAISKRQQRLHPTDINRMQNNKRLYEAPEGEKS